MAAYRPRRAALHRLGERLRGHGGRLGRAVLDHHRDRHRLPDGGEGPRLDEVLARDEANLQTLQQELAAAHTELQEGSEALEALRQLAAEEESEVVPLCASLEAELAQLDEAERVRDEVKRFILEDPLMEDPV